MFRKNYLPKLNIVQGFNGNGWFAFCSSDHDYAFVQDEEGGYSFSLYHGPTEFDTLEDLFDAVYDYTKKVHLAEVKGGLKYSKTKIKT